MTQVADGLIAFVKQDCETCVTVVPVLQQLIDSGQLAQIIVQDDASFPPVSGLDVAHDEDLALSWHADIETVPTLIKQVDGAEADRTVGWHREQWEAFTGVTGIGDGLPDQRPGCGSMSVDPDRADALNAKFGDSGVVLSLIHI